VEQTSTPVSEFYDDEIIDFRYYLILLRTVIYKFYPKIIIFSLVCVFGAVLVAQNLAPRFVATVTLHIAPRDTGVFNANQLWWERNDPAFQKTQIGILQSHKLVSRVVETTRLHREEVLLRKSQYQQLKDDWLPDIFGDQELDSPMTEAIEIELMAEKLGAAISVQAPSVRDQSYLIRVSVTLPDAELATRAANTLADVYIEEVFNTEIDKALKSQSWLTERLVKLRQDLREAEEKLQQYRESEDILARSGRSALEQELDLVSERYFKAREDRLAIENLYDQVKNVRSSNTNLENIPAVMTNPLVQNLNNTIYNLRQKKSELSDRYGSRHNKMIALESELSAARQSLKTQVANVIEGIKSDYDVALKRERSLDETLESARGKKQFQGRKQYQLRELEQEVESKRTVYTVFLSKFNEEDASGPIQNTNVWVTDPATVPQKPTGRSMQSIVLVVLILSLMAGVGLGILFELIDNTVRTPDDVEQKLGTNVLGVLPLITDKTLNQRELLNIGHRYYLENQTSTFAEAIRSVRTSLALMTLNKPSKRVLVTSSQKGEGKTSVALSLAASFGLTSRALLIDADFRRPSIMRSKDANSSQRLGLSDVIAGVTTVADALIRDEDGEMDILPAGRISPNPLELLSSTEFSVLLNDMSENYDKIVIDSAPCLPVSDSYLISSQVDSIVFVVKAATTTVPDVRTVLKRFASLNVDVSGVLLNYVDFDASYNSDKYVGYYDYHGYSGPESKG
jgi:capsular exopolysaccharide synthesis family protein